MSEEPITLGEMLASPPEYGANAQALPPNGICPRYLRITDIDDAGRLLHDDVRSIPSLVAAPYLLEHNDIVIARTGNTVGKAYLHETKNGPLAFAGYLIRFRLDTNKAHPRFIFQFLHSPGYFAWVQRTLRTGAQPNINATEYKSLVVPHFDMQEQHRIAEVLSSLDEAIEQTEALRAKYQQIKAGLMQDLFTRGVTPDGRLRPTYAESPHLYKKSLLGWIPREWEIASLSSCLVGIDAGRSPDCPDIPAAGDQWGVLKVGAVHPDGLRECENKIIVDDQFINAAVMVRDNDILLSRANTSDLVGLVCHVEGSPHNLLLSDKTLRLRPDLSRTTPRFFFWALQTTSARRQIENSATGTSGSMKNISQVGVRRIRVALPAIPEQRAITNQADAVTGTVALLRADLAKLRNVKQGLMHALLTGRVRVPLLQVENQA